MRYSFLGSTGLKVSNIVLGTGTFGTGWGYAAERSVACKVFENYRKAGGNFIDTADFYQFTEAEEILGELIAGDRDDIVVASKFGMGETPNSSMQGTGNCRKAMAQCVEASLRRLKTDRIDMFWAHLPDGVTPMEEVVRGFEDLARSGKILYAGLSNFAAWRTATAAMIAEFRGWTSIAAVQTEYNLMERSAEREIIPMAQAFGMAALAWSPLGGGVLTGKYRRGETGRKQARDFGFQDDSDPRKAAILDAVFAVADESGHTPSQIALAWILAKGILPIIGARTQAQLDESIVAAGIELSGEQVGALDTASFVEPGTPYFMPYTNRDGLTRGMT
ncbi:MAG: aldo/keto reductase [Novosphingobium sp.]